MLTLVRAGDRWEEHPGAKGDGHRTGLLPGFALDVTAILG